MCTHPITIPNPTRSFVPGSSKNYLVVPCGKCYECKEKIRDEWFVRAFFEHKRVLSKGGQTWFPLLTYDDDHIFRYRDDDLNFQCCGFDPEHIKKFRDMLRVYLTRDGYDCSGENRISFKLCPEYGDDGGRPHWHCLLFIPFPLSTEYMMGKWKVVDGKRRLVGGLIQKCWKYGFVSWSRDKETKRLRPFIETYGGIKYAMKYVSKNSKWEERFGITEYRKLLQTTIKVLRSQYIHSGTSYVYSDKILNKLSLYEQKLSSFRRALPRNYTSTNFGISGLECFCDSDGCFDLNRFIDGTINLSPFGLLTDKGKTNYFIPRYYKLKAMYNSSDGVLSLNDLGIEYNLAMYQRNKDKLVKLYRVYTNPRALSAHLAPLKLVMDLNFKAISQKFNRSLGIGNVEDLAMYNLCFRYVTLVENSKGNYIFNPNDIDRWHLNHTFDTCISLTPDKQLDFFRENQGIFYLSAVTPAAIPCASEEVFARQLKFKNTEENGYQQFDCFSGFEIALGIFDKYESLFRELKDKGQLSEQKKIDDLLQLQYFDGWFDV